MKILALVTDAYGGYGGISQYNRDFLAALSTSAEVEELVVQPRIANEANLSTPTGMIQNRAVKNKYLYALHALWACIRLRPDVIYCGHVYHGPLATQLARTFNSLVISQLHGTEVWQTLSKKHLAPLETSAVVLCVSQDTKARYERQSLMALNAHVLPNTVSPTFKVSDSSVAKAAFGLERKYTILTVSRLPGGDGYKGHDRIIRMMPRLIERRSNLEYVIAGDGPDRARLKALAVRLGVSDRVRFQGLVPPEQMPLLYNAADLFALPSSGEGFGIVFLEAMACGTPAIGLAIGGATDALFHPLYSMAAEAKEFDSALIDMVSRKSDMTDAARTELSRTTHTKFGNDLFSKRVTELIQSLAGQSVG